ncbi:protein scabrous-like [Octopus sinensis]|uniref:Protein scabrous-like n=1 Tax=Octopus sinensis TaxID=2607531 RepID=A0A6P7TFS2_9MOLL|nr:protein scabrous-like [Octopus sinensis]
MFLYANYLCLLLLFRTAVCIDMLKVTAKAFTGSKLTTEFDQTPDSRSHIIGTKSDSYLPDVKTTTTAPAMGTNLLSSNDNTHTASILHTTKSDSATINHQRRPPRTTQVKFLSSTTSSPTRHFFTSVNSLQPKKLTTKSRNDSIRKAKVTLMETEDPIEDKVDYSDFQDLLPVVALVEKLQSQVTDLQRLRDQDKLERAKIQQQLSHQGAKVRQITNDVFYLRRMASKNERQINRLSGTIENQLMTQSSLVNTEAELRVRLDDFRFLEMNISQMVSDLHYTFQNFTSETLAVSEEVENLKQEMKNISDINTNQSAAIKHMQKVVSGFVVELVPEGYYKESLDNITPQQEGILVDVKTKQIANKMKYLMSESEDNSGDTIPENTTNFGGFQQKLSKGSVALKSTEEAQRLKKYEEELTKLHKMFINLSVDFEYFKSMFTSKQLKMSDGHFQNLVLNLTERMGSVEKLKALNAELLSNNQESQVNIFQIRNMVLNNTHKLAEIKKLMTENRNENEIQPKQFKDQFFAINKSIEDLKNNLHHARNKAERRLAEKLKIVSKEMQMTQYKLTALEARVLNDSLSLCVKKNRDLEQNLKLHDLDKNIRKLEGIMSSQRDQVKRLEYRVYQLHYWNRNQSEVIDILKNQAQAIYNNLPLIEHVEEELNNFRHHLPTDCSNIKESDDFYSSIQVIYPRGSSSSVQVLCEVDEDGIWTVFQKRYNGSVDFNRSWEEYKHGFGTIDTEYWLGNEYIHLLTNNDAYSLKIEMIDLDKRLWVAVYDNFHVSSESTGYTLNIGTYSGNATDSLQYANHSPFSTVDADHDASSTHCAVHYTAGWWYKHCHYGNLNGRYNVGIVWFNQLLDDWIQMESSIMKIKKITDFEPTPL